MSIAIEELHRSLDPRPSVKPAWGLVDAIPEGVVLSWGCRAIYSLMTVTRPVNKRSKLASTTREPSIDIVHDRHSLGGLPGVIETPLCAIFCAWIDHKGIPALRGMCRGRGITTNSDEVIEFSEGGYKIVASPKASHGYLYIAAWRVAS